MASEAQTPANGRSDEPAEESAGPPVPRWLRLRRAVAGVGLLGVAWATVMAALLLALNTLGVPPHRHVFVRLALYVVGAVGTLWLAAVALTCLIVGAFCLSLALTSRGWH